MNQKVKGYVYWCSIQIQCKVAVKNEKTPQHQSVFIDALAGEVFVHVLSSG